MTTLWETAALCKPALIPWCFPCLLFALFVFSHSKVNYTMSFLNFTMESIFFLMIFVYKAFLFLHAALKIR